MKDFLEYLEKQEIISSLIDNYGGIIKGDKVKEFLNHIINTLSVTNNFHEDLDIIGFVYENTKNKDDRKALGEFYTPKSIVDYILNTVGYNPEFGIERKSMSVRIMPNEPAWTDQQGEWLNFSPR